MDRPPIESQSFDVGHEALDAEHRRLVALINDLCASVTTHDAKAAARRLRALTAEANRHTEHETLVLRGFRRAIEQRNSVPQHLKTAMAAAIEDHIGDHMTLRDRLAEVKRTVRNGGWEAGASLCQTVEMWFLEHAVRHDTQIKAIIRSVQPEP